MATVVTTAVLVAWRSAFSPVVGEGTLVPWTVLGLLLAVTTLGTDQLTRSFVGVATTALGAVLAAVLTGGRTVSMGEVVGDSVYLAVAAGAMAAGWSGLALLCTRVARSQRRAWTVAALGGATWVVWLGWWPLSDTAPARPDLWTVGAICTLGAATAAGDVWLGTWRGAMVALPPAALLAVAPLATTDALWIIAWIVLVVAGAVVCLVTVGAVALTRGGWRRLRPAARSVRP